MTNAQRSHFESLLLSERKRTLRDLASIAAELEEAGDEGDNQPSVADSGDLARAAASATLDTAMATRESTGLTDIDQALEQLYHDPESYGRCAECRRPISLARLELVPATRFCASHAAYRKIPD